MLKEEPPMLPICVNIAAPIVKQSRTQLCSSLGIKISFAMLHALINCEAGLTVISMPAPEQ